NYDIGKFIEQHVGPDDQILLSTSFFNSVAFVSHKPLKQFIHEGASELWQATLIDPYEHADWIVMSNGDVGETVFSTLLKHNPQKFLAFYKVAFVGKHAYVFKRRAPHELFVRREGDELLVGKEAFEVRGVNAYDLAFRSEAEIEQSFAE